MKTVGIIGASGYVGMHIAGFLSKAFEVTALQRNVHAIMPEIPGVQVRSLEENRQTFDILINTSYNSDKDINRVYESNKEVLNRMRAAAHPQTKIIHLSSLAVFGYGLDRNIIPKAVKLRKDYGHVMSKIHMENLLLQHFSHEQLSIVRLGNVWGPANNSWTQPVANALQWGLPVLNSTPAFSNITYVHHISHYLQYIIRHSDNLLFHHLAEFSDVNWQQVIHEMAAYLGVDAASLAAPAFYAKSFLHDLQHAFAINPVTTAKRLKSGRFSSHYFPGWLISALSAPAPANKIFSWKEPPYEPPVTFYWVLSCNTEFKSHTLSGWTAPYSWKEVSDNVCNWLGQAGFKNV